jgi:hypothetical protein
MKTLHRIGYAKTSRRQQIKGAQKERRHLLRRFCIALAGEGAANGRLAPANDGAPPWLRTCLRLPLELFIWPASLAEGENRMPGAAVIHIVDDDPSFRTAISRVLNVSGYEVVSYESMACFLRAAENARPGCILLDVQMPPFAERIGLMAPPSPADAENPG